MAAQGIFSGRSVALTRRYRDRGNRVLTAPSSDRNSRNFGTAGAAAAGAASYAAGSGKQT